MAHPFQSIPAAKLESLNNLQAQFMSDPSPDKVHLMYGVYRTEKGEPFVLPAVKEARQKIFDDPTWNHEYPSSHLGEKPFRDASHALLFGGSSSIVRECRIASMQTLGASGACHMGAAFLRHHYKPHGGDCADRKVYIPAESWVNHANIFRHEGFETADFPYYEYNKHRVDATALNANILALPACSIIVLQVCGNNPTGCDLSFSDWSMLATTLLARSHFAFLDISYMGFVTGDAEQDCAPIRLLVERLVPLLVATTYGKPFGLYGERVGHLCIPAPSAEVAARMEDQMKLLARAETGALPRFGARIVSTIFEDENLRRTWRENLKDMAEQLRERRLQLRKALEGLETPGDWDFLTEQKGMFLYTGFTAEQVSYLRDQHHVYVQDTGRLSIAGLNATNVAHVARSFYALVTQRSNAKMSVKSLATNKDKVRIRDIVVS